MMKNKALSSDFKTGWLVLVGCRWISLAVVFAVLLVGSRSTVPPGVLWLLLFLSSAYTLFLTLGRDFLSEAFTRSYLPLVADIMICFGLLFFSGASDSPFYLYSLSPVLLAAFLKGGRPGIVTGLISLTAYVLAVTAGGSSFAGLVRNAGADQLSAMAAYLMVAVFFAYPSGFLRQLQERNQELVKAKESLATVNKNLESVNRQLVAVQTINAVLQSYLDIPTVMTSILDGIKYGFDFDRVTVGLFDERTNTIGEWRVIGGRGTSEASEREWKSFELPIALDSATDRLFSANKPLVVDGTGTGEVDRRLAEFIDTEAYAIMPLSVRSAPAGLIIVDNSVSSRPIAPEDVAWLEVLATHAAIAINNARLFSKAQELAAITERNRIAMEIHDGLSQTLYGARLILSSCSRILPAAPEQVQVKLTYLDKMLARSYEEIRYAIYNLRLPFLSVESLTVFFRQSIEEFAEFSGIKSRLAVSGSEDDALLSEDIKLCLSRVLQESLNNAQKHSGATSLTVFFNFQAGRVILKIVDNGRGFRVQDALEQAKTGKTFGIVATENRVRRLGGNFVIESSPDLGTSVKATMPYSVTTEVDLDKSARR
ncbi:MAG: GAF domain-containing sensor histidine kinase [Actinomycetota bacterium]|nr:GAF domain-containing sensor histidine kinase [Actinomycetota bacterium]